MAFYQGAILIFRVSWWEFRRNHLYPEIQKQKAPGSDWLVDLWDEVFMDFTSIYNKDMYSPTMEIPLN